MWLLVQNEPRSETTQKHGIDTQNLLKNNAGVPKLLACDRFK